MLRNINLFSFLARSIALSSSSCQATKLSACARTYGLLLSRARFLNGLVSIGFRHSSPERTVVSVDLFSDAAN